MKYQKLTEHLTKVKGNRWDATFEEVERVIGVPLPESARQYPAWWANQGRGQSKSWELAGWKSTNVDIANETVSFDYVAGGTEKPVRKLTIDQAKQGLAANFNVPVDAIEIVVRG